MLIAATRTCADPRPGDVARHARRPAPTATRWPTTTTACRARRSSSARTATRASSCAARPTRTCVCPTTLLQRRPARPRHGRRGVRRAARRRAPTRSSRSPGCGPQVGGVLTRSRGDFERDPRGLRPDRRADRRARAGARLRAARDAGRQATSSTANKQLLSQHGEELWARAREHGVQLRFEAAVAGVVPVIRVLQESLAAAHVERDARDRQRHDELHPHRDGARPARPTTTALARGPGARLRRGRPDRRRHRPRRGGQDGDPRAAGLRHAGPPRPGRLRGDRADHGRRHRVRARARPRR